MDAERRKGTPIAAASGSPLKALRATLRSRALVRRLTDVIVADKLTDAILDEAKI